MSLQPPAEPPVVPHGGVSGVGSANAGVSAGAAVGVGAAVGAGAAVGVAATSKAGSASAAGSGIAAAVGKAGSAGAAAASNAASAGAAAASKVASGGAAAASKAASLGAAASKAASAGAAAVSKAGSAGAAAASKAVSAGAAAAKAGVAAPTAPAGAASQLPPAEPSPGQLADQPELVTDASDADYANAPIPDGAVESAQGSALPTGGETGQPSGQASAGDVSDVGDLPLPGVGLASAAAFGGAVAAAAAAKSAQADIAARTARAKHGGMLAKQGDGLAQQEGDIQDTLDEPMSEVKTDVEAASLADRPPYGAVTLAGLAMEPMAVALSKIGAPGPSETLTLKCVSDAYDTDKADKDSREFLGAMTAVLAAPLGWMPEAARFAAWHITNARVGLPTQPAAEELVHSLHVALARCLHEGSTADPHRHDVADAVVRIQAEPDTYRAFECMAVDFSWAAEQPKAWAEIFDRDTDELAGRLLQATSSDDPQALLAQLKTDDHVNLQRVMACLCLYVLFCSHNPEYITTLGWAEEATPFDLV